MKNDRISLRCVATTAVMFAVTAVLIVIIVMLTSCEKKESPTTEVKANGEECFSLWCDQIVKDQGRINALPSGLTDNFTQKVQDMPVNSVSLMNYYFSATTSTVSYPVDKLFTLNN